MNKSRIVFVCQHCGKESPKWLGRCSNCQEWNSFIEKVMSVTTQSISETSQPQELSAVTSVNQDRLKLPLPEFNRTLGGGLVPGSLVLIGGEPGIGKSTLLLQLSAMLAKNEDNIIYVSGEETMQQIKLRAQRLKIEGKQIYLLSETNVEAILANIEDLNPCLVIVDSIQAVYLPEIETMPGSIPQVRECTMRIMQWAKKRQVPLIITGHVTKDGSIAGPRILEHIVDCVLYLEGDSFSPYRLLRSVKNRFGSTNEVGIFEMKTQGLVEIENPSRVFISQRSDMAVGSVVVPTLEGSRPLLVEVQALTNATSFGLPRRTANGVDFGRLLMVIAVLCRRVGLKLASQDIIVNATGGMRISEPAADLAIALAIASSYSDKEVNPELLAVAEIGLSGELRTVPQLERRLGEAARQGFTRCLVPAFSTRASHIPKELRLVPASTLKEAIKLGLVGKKEHV
ncbi:MAG: DNA repair protein RadA [Dehalococcoidia bacterium]|nr:MAG: DNA repair protein RadA [Dehalococcoidia bacterium]